MSAPDEIDFKQVFHSVPGLFLIVRPDANFTIVEASDAFLAAAFMRRDAIIGRPLFEVFPDESDINGGPASSDMRASLARVIAHKTADPMPVQQYAVQRPASFDGDLEERFWS